MRRHIGWSLGSGANTSIPVPPCAHWLAALSLFAVVGCSGGYSSSQSSESPAAPKTKSSATSPTATGTTAAPTTAPTKAPAKTPAKAPAVDAGVGRDLYGRFCAMCHGSSGKGNGPLAGSLDPKPRGFVNEPWRFIDASTPDSIRLGLVRVIKEGLPTSGMPGFATQLSDDQATAVAEHVLSLQEAGR